MKIAYGKNMRAKQRSRQTPRSNPQNGMDIEIAWHHFPNNTLLGTKKCWELTTKDVSFVNELLF